MALGTVPGHNAWGVDPVDVREQIDSRFAAQILEERAGEERQHLNRTKYPPAQFVTRR